MTAPTPFAAGRAGSPVRLRVCTLGAALVHVGGMSVTPSSGVLFALLVRLAHTPGMAVTRDQLVAELWPGYDPVRQRANLRQALYKLRSMGVRITAGHAVVALDPAQVAPSFALERTIARFQGQVLTQAEPFGAFLPGFSVERGELAEWVELQRGVVHGEVRHVLVEALRQRREAGEWGGAEAVARALLQLDPLNEEATLQLAECVMLAGAKVEAVGILDRFLAELGEVPAEVRERALVMRRRFQDPPPRKVREREPEERHFVGREAELAQLTQALRRARWQDGGAVLLHGAPGIGKTRLTQALASVAAAEGFREVRLGCREGDEGSRFQLLGELVRRLLALPGALGCEPESLQRLRRQWPERGRGAAGGEGDAAPWAEAGVGAGDRARDAAAEFVQQAATREALLDLVAAVAEERPLLVVVEDVHWLDAGSWQVLQLFVSASGAVRLLVVCTTRERTPAALREVAPSPRLATLAVGPLAPAAREALVTAVATEYAAALPAGLAARLAETSEGNPLFLRALVKHWVDTGEGEGIPGTLAQLLEARLDRLPPLALTVLQTIVALGALARVERLREAVGVGPAALVGALDALEMADCIRSVPPHQVASHDLVGRAAWARLSPASAAVLTGAVADVLEREYRQSGAEGLLPAVLAGLGASGRGERFARLLTEAQGAVLALGNPAPVLQLAAQLATEWPGVFAGAGVRGVLSQLQAQAGNYAESLRLAGGVARLPVAEGTLDERTAAAMLTYLDSAYRSDVMHDIDFTAEAVARLCELPHLPWTLRLDAARCGLVIAANQASLDLAGRCFSTISASRSVVGIEVKSQYPEMIYHTSFGDIEQARAIACSLASELPNDDLTTNEISKFDNVAFALRYCGESDLAIRLLERTHQASIHLDLPHHAQFSAWQLAVIADSRGDNAGYRQWLAVLVDLCRLTDAEGQSNPIVGFLLRAAVRAGDKDQANALLKLFKKTLGANTTKKGMAYAAAIEIAVQMLDSTWVPDRAQIDVSVERFRAVATVGLNDFIFLLNITALCQSERLTEARSLAFEYFYQLRRDREAILPDLKRLMAELGVFPLAPPK